MPPLLVVSLLTIAQALPTFEVASVKRGQANSGVEGGCRGIDSRYAPNEAPSAPPLGRCVIHNGRLGHLLAIAYRLRSMALVTGGPDWVKLGDDRFDIEAKADDPTKATEAQLLEMLQALLIERFEIKMRQETKDVPGFALVVAKNGPKLQAAKGQDVIADFGQRGKAGPGPNTVVAHNFTMPKLADLLTMSGEPVIDHTGLAGSYDFTLSWDETAGPSLTTALREQLGLKFESQKVPVSFIVVESARKPAAN
jgi:uncharacterized protein (TIGR03435 family)